MNGLAAAPSAPFSEASLVANGMIFTVAIILPATGLTAAAGVAERIRQTTMAKELRRRKTGESLGRVTVSLGVAEYRRPESAQDLVERADNCLYAAKRRGRNCVVAQDQLVAGSPQPV